MKNLKTLMSLIFIVFLPFNLRGGQEAEHIVIAKQILVYLQEEKHEEIIPFFDATMRQHLNQTALANIWRGMIMQYGPLREVTEIWTESKNDYLIVAQRCVFKKDTLQFRLTFDGNNGVAGMFFQPDQP